MTERYIVTLDPGSSKLGLAVAKVCGRDINLVFYREYPSDGIRHGKVLNPLRAGNAIRTAVAEAEKELGIKIESVAVPLPRFGIRQEVAPGTIARTNPDECITIDEINLLKDNALDSYTPDDPVHEEVYEAIAQSFTTEDLFQCKEEDILGSVGDKIEGNFRIFIGSKGAVTNLERALSTAQLSTGRKYFEPALIADAVLTDSEMDNGVALFEIGAGVSSVSIYQAGNLRYYGSIPFGGRNVSIDIKNEAGIREVLAENIKLGYGACIPEKLQTMAAKTLMINDEDQVVSRKLPVTRLSEIIDCRMREIFEALLYCVHRSGLYGKLRSGIVLCGGSAELQGAASLLAGMSGLNVRVGYSRIKGITSTGFPQFKDESAAVSAAMILRAGTDPYFSSTASGANTGEELRDTVFDPGKEEKNETSKSVKKRHQPTWGKKVRLGVGGIVDDAVGLFDSTVGKLYENFDNQEN